MTDEFKTNFFFSVTSERVQVFGKKLSLFLHNKIINQSISSNREDIARPYKSHMIECTRPWKPDNREEISIVVILNPKDS